jgi:hypothetical protein
MEERNAAAAAAAAARDGLLGDARLPQSGWCNTMDCVVQLAKAPTLRSLDRGFDPLQCSALAVWRATLVSNSWASFNAAGGP